MDVNVKVKQSVRHGCIEAILCKEEFASCIDELLRELAFAKDKHGREVIHITDPCTRQYFYDRLYFCGRYEIFEGPPIHISNTAVVVMAYDHGVCNQVFQDKSSDAGLDEKGFIACNEILGRAGWKIQNKKQHKKLEKEEWHAEFRLWDKDENGLFSKDEFQRYCKQQFGSKLQVAIKFMKNRDEYNRERNSRENLNNESILSLVPSATNATIQENLKRLKFIGGQSMTMFPYAIVMPAADRNLTDIYTKESPHDNELRTYLQQIANGLECLHQNDLVHGDLKSLNVVRVANRLKLIDLDAATSIGDPAGAKFSSGSLPPEYFYKIKIDKSGFMAQVDAKESKVEADPSLDVWAVGVLMYQLYSGEELVATDINQDVVDDKIEQAATWTQNKLNSRIRNKVPNPLVRELLEKILVVDPDDRASMDVILEYAYFKVDSSGTISKMDLQTNQDETRQLIRDTHDRALANGAMDGSAVITTGNPAYLYLLDEVDGTPVVSLEPGNVYPIRIETRSPQFLAVVSPFLQAGLHLLKGVNTATKLAKCVGISNPTWPVLDNAIKILEAAKNESSVVNFNVVHAAIQAESVDPVPVQRIRGAALCELERFFNEKDPNKTYAGLQRMYTADGHALWTSVKNAKRINAAKSRPETVVEVLLLKHEMDRVVLMNGDSIIRMNGTKNIKEDENKEGGITWSESGSSQKKEEKICTCELM
ncbi:Aste57867_16176 [Aphanomyces stellatus]|uniref:Aste57867_16176 protein n=1 Tax=Aphanomyces stellatus TaxID=120398 RepID=A0A485KDH5_9STRA|nr:hypothetical protein As57867_016120 [Aphanomyces stellatus]KAF0710675.1 hypothetical protein As57867_005473 [Aphanomyces stellatus]VFT82537.1 Aste57867_5486 [Aphanomyces stellatus]VFT92954.1 Aste57867_16176 [Aphanomyces stellatus]